MKTQNKIILWVSIVVFVLLPQIFIYRYGENRISTAKMKIVALENKIQELNNLKRTQIRIERKILALKKNYPETVRKNEESSLDILFLLNKLAQAKHIVILKSEAKNNFGENTLTPLKQKLLMMGNLIDFFAFLKEISKNRRHFRMYSIKITAKENLVFEIDWN